MESYVVKALPAEGVWYKQQVHKQIIISLYMSQSWTFVVVN